MHYFYIRRLCGVQAYSLLVVADNFIRRVWRSIVTFAACRRTDLLTVCGGANFTRRLRWHIVTFVACAAYKYTRRLRGEQQRSFYENFQRNVRDA